MARPFTKFDGGGYPGLAAVPGTRDGTKFLRDDGTWQNPGSGSIAGLLARFLLADADVNIPNGVDLSLLSSGILQHVVTAGISVPNSFAAGSGRILHGSGTNGGLTDSALLAYLSDVLTLGGRNGSAITVALTNAATQIIEKQGGGDLYLGTLGAQLLGLYTNNLTRQLFTSAGDIDMRPLIAGGYVTAAAGVFGSGGGRLGRVAAIPVADVTGAVPNTRTISTTSPLTGGGDLSANRTFAITDFAGSGSRGAVPDPTAETDRFLRDDGTWSKPQGDFILHLGYGPDAFSGNLPVVAEAVPHFWLHPFTSLDNVSAQGTGSTHNDMIIEWEVGATYTDAFLDVYVRTSSLSDPGTVASVAITKNGTDTGVAVTIPDSETNTRHQDDDNVAFTDGDRVGVHVTMSNDYTTGSLIMSVTVRLR